MGADAIRCRAVLALAALTVSACSLWEPKPLSTDRPLALTPQPTPTAATHSPSPATLPSPSPEPTPDPPSPSPTPSPEAIRFVPALPDDDETDLRRIYDALLVAAREQGNPPDPARVSDVYTESCPCFGDFFRTAEEFAAKGLRAEGPVPETLEFRVLGPASDGESQGWRIEAVRSFAGGRVIDAEGRTIRELRPIERQRVLTTVLRHEGKWKFADIEFPDG